MSGPYQSGRRLMVVLVFAFFALCIQPDYVLGAKSGKKSPAPAVALSDDMSPAEVDSTMATMDDAQARKALHEKLTSEAEAHAQQKASRSRSNQLMDVSTSIRERLLEIKSSRGHILDDLGRSLQAMAHGEGFGALLLACLGALLIAFVAWMMETLFRRKVSGLRNRMQESGAPPAKGRVLAVDTFIAVSGLLLYVAVVVTLFSAFFGKETPGYVAAAHILMFFLFLRPVQVVARLLLRPKTPEIRPVPVGDQAALALNSFIGTLIVLAFGSKFALDAFQAAGTPEAALIVLQLAFVCIILLFLSVAILFYREEVANAIVRKQDDGTPAARLRMQLAMRWHFFAILYLGLVAMLYLAVLLIQGVDGPQGMFLMSLGVVPLYYLLDRVAQRILDGVFGILVAKPPKPMSMVRAGMEEGDQPEGEEVATKKDEQPRPESHPYYEVTRRTVRFLLIGFIALILLHAWHAPIPQAESIIRAGVRILVILFVAVLLWQGIKRILERKFRETGEPGETNPRLRTLLPLFQKVLGLFFLVTAVLMVIAQFGVNIGPLLAGAGVFGLAIGLGSQTLVKDVVAGVFFLMDDAFRVGDYVKMGSTEGYVVKMSVRTILLEHYLGYVLIIPYGDIKNVINFSRNPISIKIKIPMPLETDPKKFKKIVRKINQQLMEDEEFKDDLVQPIKSQGVKRIQDSTMIFGVKFMAKPGTQFSIRKEVYARLYKELKKAGLTFAAPGVTVYTAKQEAQDAEAAAQGAAAAAAQKRKAADEEAQAKE